MFDNIAPKYDFLNHFLSLGIDKLWRKKAIRILSDYHSENLLDVATGTGDFAIAAAKLKPKKIIGFDISEQMISVGRTKAKRLGLDQILQLHCNFRLFGGRESCDETHRQNAVNDDFLGTTRMGVAKTGQFRVRKVMPLEWQSPGAGMKAWGIAFVRSNDVSDGRHPVHRLIAYVPNQPQSAVRFEHSMDLGKGCFIRKPVEGLGDDDRVNASIG